MNLNPPGPALNVVISVLPGERSSLLSRRLEYRPEIRPPPSAQNFQRENGLKLSGTYNSRVAFIYHLAKVVLLDIRGPLNLAECHESHGRFASLHKRSQDRVLNEIRSRSTESIKDRLKAYIFDLADQPQSLADMLLPQRLHDLAMDIVLATDQKMLTDDEEDTSIFPFPNLLVELALAVRKCVTPQVFLGTCLYLFLAADGVVAALSIATKRHTNTGVSKAIDEVNNIARLFLRNYVALSLLIESPGLQTD